MPRTTVTKLKKYKDRITDTQIANAKRKTISEKVNGVYIDPYDFDGDINRVIANLENIRSNCVEMGYSNTYLLYDSGWGHEEASSYTIHGERTETDSDVRTRLAAKLQGAEEKKRLKKLQTEKELETLKKLAKKHQKALVDK